MVNRDTSFTKKNKKPKKERMGKETLRNFNIKNYGNEPDYDHPITDAELSIAYTWYSLNIKAPDAKDFLVAYLFDIDDPIADVINKIPPNIVLANGRSACWRARLMYRGYDFADENHEDISEALEAIVDKHEETLAKARALKLEKPTRVGDVEFVEKIITDRRGNVVWVARVPVGTEVPNTMTFDQALDAAFEARRARNEHPWASAVLETHLDVLSEADDALDMAHPKRTDMNFDLYEWLKDNKVNKLYADDYVEHFSGIRRELDAFQANDPETVERYKKIGYRDVDVTRKLELTKDILMSVNTYVTDTKAKKKEPGERKPRAKKPLSPDKIVSRLQFSVADDELSIKSIDPKKILGASELWVYNSKYGLLQVYRALSSDGLSIKGSTLLNYDANMSIGKRVGRHASRCTSEVVGGTKITLRKMMDSIASTPVVVNGRINSNTVLLRVV